MCEQYIRAPVLSNGAVISSSVANSALATKKMWFIQKLCIQKVYTDSQVAFFPDSYYLWEKGIFWADKPLAVN